MDDKKRIEELEKEIKAMEACFEHIGAGLGAVLSWVDQVDQVKEIVRGIREMVIMSLASKPNPKKILNPEDEE